MITDHRENDNYLELVRKNKVPQGLGLDIPLDDNLRFKAGNFNIVLGHANKRIESLKAAIERLEKSYIETVNRINNAI